jgi:hypothetical protein
MVSPTGVLIIKQNRTNGKSEDLEYSKRCMCGSSQPFKRTKKRIEGTLARQYTQTFASQAYSTENNS